MKDLKLLYIKNYFDNHPEALLNYNSKINLNNQKENKKSKNFKLTNSNNFNQSLPIKININDMMTERNFINF
jgi:plasmid maintenance system antidote protein VapI